MLFYIISQIVLTIVLWFAHEALNDSGCMKYAAHAGQVQRKFQMSGVALR